MLNLGQFNTLTAERKTVLGFFLLDEEGNEVLLPIEETPEDLRDGDEIEVFLYKNAENKVCATTITPKLLLNEFGALQANFVTPAGAFFDWGMEKDLFVPRSEQATAIHSGEYHVVYMFLDTVSDRLAGTTKISAKLEKTNINVSVGDEVKLLAYEETEIGIHVIVNQMYQGMLYKNEVFGELSAGEELTGYIKKVRDDGKLDVSLNKFGYRAVDANVAKVEKAILDNNGVLHLNDKSSPEEIYAQLKMSKKIFKKSIGALYREKKIILNNTGVKWIAK